jgi:diacylglycerol kinase family enzyme
MKIIIVYNPKSGSSLKRDALQAKCDENDITIEKFIPIDADLNRNLASFIDGKIVIAAVGGDGTVSAVANVLAGSKALFAPLPGGTLNHFTKDLGVPQDIDDAFAKLSKLKPRLIDVAEVNGKVFINNSSVGLYPSSLRTRKRFEKRVGKWPAAVLASIHTLVRFKTYTVTIDNKTFKTPFVFIGNNRYIMSAPGVAERKNINEGVLSIFIAKTVSRAVLLKIVLFTLIGNIRQLEEFEVRTTATLTVETSKKHQTISCDGETEYVVSPLEFKIRKRALNVLAG